MIEASSISAFEFFSSTLESFLNVTQSSLKEIFKYESWTIKFEWNLFILICLCLIAELLALFFAWHKYSAKIESVRRGSQQDQGEYASLHKCSE